MTDTAASLQAPPPGPFADTDDDHTKAMEASMIARGEPTTEPVEVDYFAPTEVFRVMLPDNVQYIEHKEFNEGARRKYLAQTNRSVKLQRSSGDAFLNMQPGEDRVALLKAAICGWKLKKNGKDFAYTPRAVDDLLESFPPKIIDLIHKDILKHNEWLLGDMTVEDIDREIASLQEQKQVIIEREAGKDAS
jgi:hypothetical protein